jgi:hypothetical protein
MPDNPAYAFDHATGEAIIKLLREKRVGYGGNDTEPLGPAIHVYIAEIPEGGIAARSGIVHSKAVCQLWKINDDDELVVGDDASVETVYNPYYFPLPAGIFVDAIREVLTGRIIAHLKGGFIGFLGYGDTITARSGTTLGSGEVNLFAQDGATLVDLSTTATCYNTSQMTPTTSEIYIQMKISHDGYLLWDVDDCA